MSAKWTFWAWEQPIKTAPKKLALLQLANNSNDGGKSWYSIGKMSEACGVGERTFQRQVQSLEEDGLLKVERRTNRPSIYTLKDEIEVTLHDLGCQSDGAGCQSDGARGVRESPDPNNDPNNDPINKDPLSTKADEIQDAFDYFYIAGLVKKSKVKAFTKFKSLVEEMKADPMEFATLLSKDIQYRITTQQFGIDKLHPSTYLNNQRWTDEYEEPNNGQSQVNGKQSAAERIAERNRQRYGQASSGLGMAEDGRDLREPMDQGTGGRAAITLDSSSFKTEDGSS